MSQAELGGDRYTGSYISHLESARRAASADVIEFLAMRLGVTPYELGMAPTLRVPEDEATTPYALEHLLVAERAWYDRDWVTAGELATKAASAALAAGQSERHWQALYVQTQAALAAVGISIAFALCFCWISVFVGMKARTSGAVQGVMFLIVLPLSFASNTYVPTSTMRMIWPLICFSGSAMRI